MVTESKLISGCQGMGIREIGNICLMGTGFPFGVMKKF